MGLLCEEHPIVDALRQTWAVTDVAGQTELVTFEELDVRWRVGTEEEYTCPYRLSSYHDEGGTIALRMNSKKRTGTDAWVEYELTFSEDRSEFRMVHSDDILDGIFRVHQP